MDELKEKYIQFCCDFYNEHAPEDRIWFSRMFDDCHQEHNKRNSSMYRWQFPLKVLKDQEATINGLKSQLNNMEACYIERKKQVEAVSQVLCELKESLKDFQEMDLYDKGYRVTTEYVIADLEQALRGAND